MNELITINNKDIEAKEFNNKRIITVWEIAELHEREVFRINENFKRNKEKFILNDDYFILSRKEFFESFSARQSFIPNNMNEIIVFTKTGYLMLTKIFDDDLSWHIQRELINNYFGNQKPMSIEDMIIAQAGEMKTVKQKVFELEDKVENQIIIDHGQQEKIRKRICARVYGRSEIIKTERKKLFSALHRDLRDRFGVTSYRDIKRLDLHNAINYIDNWIEKAELREEIA